MITGFRPGHDDVDTDCPDRRAADHVRLDDAIADGVHVEVCFLEPPTRSTRRSETRGRTPRVSLRCGRGRWRWRRWRPCSALAEVQALEHELDRGGHGGRRLVAAGQGRHRRAQRGDLLDQPGQVLGGDVLAGVGDGALLERADDRARLLGRHDAP